jgi:nitrite reductase/ring-hydroxylating ferredoxin subunit
MTSSAAPVTINKIEIPLGKSSEVPLNGAKIFTAKNRFGNSSGYVVIRNSNGVIAMSDICPHKGCSVEIQKEGLLCPCHNALFDSKTGDVLRGPASYPLERVTVRELDGVIYVTD